LTYLRLAVSLLALACLGACAGPPKNYVVLLPNPDKPDSAISLTNKAGSVLVDHPGEAAGTDSASEAPGKPYAVDENKVQQVFAAALAAQPEPPVSFILYFKTESTELAAASQQELPEILATIRRRKAPDVSVVGHTDLTGTAEFNNRLARRRAEAVRNLIVGQGVDPSMIDVSSHGKNNPLIKTADGVPEPRNRRVEVTVR